MSELFSIDGYWKDDKLPFEGYIVSSDDSVLDDDSDDDVFFYGMSESELQEAITLGENTVHDFVITKYQPINQ
jgi:hypothetical protein